MLIILSKYDNYMYIVTFLALVQKVVFILPRVAFTYTVHTAS